MLQGVAVTRYIQVRAAPVTRGNGMSQGLSTDSDYKLPTLRQCRRQTKEKGHDAFEVLFAGGKFF